MEIDQPVHPLTMKMCQRMCTKIIEIYKGRVLKSPFIPMLPLLNYLLKSRGVETIGVIGWIRFRRSDIDPPFGKSISIPPDNVYYFPSMWLSGHSMIIDPAMGLFIKRYPSGSGFERVTKYTDSGIGTECGVSSDSIAREMRAGMLATEIVSAMVTAIANPSHKRRDSELSAQERAERVAIEEKQKRLNDMLVGEKGIQIYRLYANSPDDFMRMALGHIFDSELGPDFEMIYKSLA